MTRITFVLLTFLLTSLSSAVQAERVALVIGNSAYQHTAKLANPRNDPSDISTALRTRGFEVLEGFDLDKVSLDRRSATSRMRYKARMLVCFSTLATGSK